MADLNAPLAVATFHYHGFMVMSDPTSKFVEEAGRADLKLLRGGKGVAVEIKQGKKGFDLDNLRDNQRDWAMRYCIAPPFSTQYWLFLTIGTHPPNYNPEKYLPRRSWLLDYRRFLEVDKIIRAITGQRTLVYKATKNHKIAVREGGHGVPGPLDALTLLKGYELRWNKTGTLLRPSWLPQNAGAPYTRGLWTVPKEHPFFKQFIKGDDVNGNRNGAVKPNHQKYTHLSNRRSAKPKPIRRRIAAGPMVSRASRQRRLVRYRNRPGQFVH